MKLEQPVCSLDLAQKLKGLGVSQDANFYWTLEKSGDDYVTNLRRKGWKVKWYENDRVAAFSVAELGKHFENVRESSFYKAYGHVFNVPDTEVITSYGWLQCVTNPDILAKMLVYLLENKLI